MSTLALIPARGGSKGVPRKNIRNFAGKPLIAWTIEAALRSCGCSRVVVSTDDAEIARAAREFGAETPFIRPAALAGDTASSESVILHALGWLSENEGYTPDNLLLLQPTSPFRTAADIDNALQLLEAKEASAVIGVTENRRPLQWLRAVSPDGWLINPGFGENVRRQDAPLLFEMNGAIYLVRTETYLAEATLYPERTAPYLMPPERSLDIDTPLDFTLGELFMQHNLTSGSTCE